MRTVNGYHIYEFEGIRYPSVTTILSRTESDEDKKSLRNWQESFSMKGFKNAFDYSKYASTRGTILHYNILNSIQMETTGIQLDMSGIPEIPLWWSRRENLMREITYCKTLWDNLEWNIKPPMAIESPTYHPEMKYAGTPDLRAIINGKKTLIDLKTSKKVYEKHITQITAYFQMINYWLPDSVEQAILVYLNPNMRRALVYQLPVTELILQSDLWEDKLREFWENPRTRVEYGLQ